MYLLIGADAGIGRAVAVAFAMEGAKVAIVYNENDEDAAETERLVEEKGGACLVIKADVRQKAACENAVNQTVEAFGTLHILVNNAANQKAQPDLEDIDEDQLRRSIGARLNLKLSHSTYSI